MTMTLRYAHLSHEHKKKAVNLLNGLTAMAQNGTKDAFPAAAPPEKEKTSSQACENTHYNCDAAQVVNLRPADM
jgi:hypothetical protein